MGNESNAPGVPGIDPKWTSSAKDGVGCALHPLSRVWFTISHGIVNEIYYPRVDHACVRDMELLIADGREYFVEEKRDTQAEATMFAPGVPAYRIVNTTTDNRFVLEKEIFCDPTRDSLLQRVRLKGSKEREAWNDTMSLYVLLAPHLGNRGRNNTGWVGEYKGTRMLFAERSGTALALACSTGWRRRSSGYVGVSDGWQDISQHKRMTWEYQRAEDGNVALVGEVNLENDGESPECVLALGFGADWSEAANRAISSLEDDYERLRDQYESEWQQWQDSLFDLEGAEPEMDDSEREKSQGAVCDLYRTSTAVIKIHEEKQFPGGVIASLSIPWGFSKGDDDLGGYHLAWPRDLCETAGGYLAAGAFEDVLRVLHYLQSTQEIDGRWPQNMWLDGQPYWSGVQMDEVSLPILLVDMARRELAIDTSEICRLWPMVREAARFIVRNGPVTPQDRWEEDPGYSPFTLATEISALLVAADLAEQVAELEPESTETKSLAAAARYLRETADAWYTNIDRWIYAKNTDLAHDLNIEGHYVRIAPPDVADDESSSIDGYIPIKNRPPGESRAPATKIVSPDALALVRFGLRSPHDPRIRNTIAAIDAMLCDELPQGPAWHRYNEDGYGEHEDGSPFDGVGIGRCWPLLIGERAHYELAAGRHDEARRLLKTFRASANNGGMLPEQTWDADDIPERELFRGRPAGSAMPLVWAHAEYLKLLRSLYDGEVFDTPPQTVQRYQHDQTTSQLHIWRFNHKCRQLPAGKRLRVELPESAMVHWTVDGWNSSEDSHTADSLWSVHFVDLDVAKCQPGCVITMTFYWKDRAAWQGEDFEVIVTDAMN